MPTKVCVDLFAGLGGFSAAFRDSDEWEVVTVEIEDRFDPDVCADVFDLRPMDIFEAIGYERDEIDLFVVVASPPCRYLNTAGNHDKWNFNTQEPTAPESRNAVALFYHALGLIRGVSPDFHYVENPRASRIRWFVGPPGEWVTYCQYGKDYQKPTGLWGNYAPMTFERCPAGANCHVSNTEDDGTEAVASMDGGPAERAKVPYDLSEAIREAVDAEYANPTPTQPVLADYC